MNYLKFCCCLTRLCLNYYSKCFCCLICYVSIKLMTHYRSPLASALKTRSCQSCQRFGCRTDVSCRSKPGNSSGCWRQAGPWSCLSRTSGESSFCRTASWECWTWSLEACVRRMDLSWPAWSRCSTPETRCQPCSKSSSFLKSTLEQSNLHARWNCLALEVSWN